MVTRLVGSGSAIERATRARGVSFRMSVSSKGDARIEEREMAAHGLGVDLVRMDFYHVVNVETLCYAEYLEEVTDQEGRKRMGWKIFILLMFLVLCCPDFHLLSGRNDNVTMLFVKG